MPTNKQTISVRLDSEAKHRVERAARLMRQSSGAFLEKVGTERARQVLLDWAVSRHRQVEASFSELAEETGLAVEEIMEAAGSRGKDEALGMFLASCRTIAENRGNPEFLRLGEEAIKTLESAHGSVESSGRPEDFEAASTAAKDSKAERTIGTMRTS